MFASLWKRTENKHQVICHFVWLVSLTWKSLSYFADTFTIAWLNNEILSYYTHTLYLMRSVFMEKPILFHPSNFRMICSSIANKTNISLDCWANNMDGWCGVYVCLSTSAMKSIDGYTNSISIRCYWLQFCFECYTMDCNKITNQTTNERRLNWFVQQWVKYTTNASILTPQAPSILWKRNKAREK